VLTFFLVIVQIVWAVKPLATCFDTVVRIHARGRRLVFVFHDVILDDEWMGSSTISSVVMFSVQRHGSESFFVGAILTRALVGFFVALVVVLGHVVSKVALIKEGLGTPLGVALLLDMLIVFMTSLCLQELSNTGKRSLLHWMILVKEFCILVGRFDFCLAIVGHAPG